MLSQHPVLKTGMMQWLGASNPPLLLSYDLCICSPERCVCVCGGGAVGIHFSVHYLDRREMIRSIRRDLENGWPRFAAHSGLSSVFPSGCHVPRGLLIIHTVLSTAVSVSKFPLLFSLSLWASCVIIHSSSTTFLFLLSGFLLTPELHCLFQYLNGLLY